MTLKEEMQKKRDERFIRKGMVGGVVKSVKEFFLKLQEKDINGKVYVAALDIEEYEDCVEIMVRKADEDIGDLIYKLMIHEDKLKKFVDKVSYELEKEGISCTYSGGITIIMSITLN